MITLKDYDKLDSIGRPGSESDPFRRYRSTIACGDFGKWKIERFEVEKRLALLHMMRDGRGTPPGMYTRLVHETRGIVMSDTDAGIYDHMRFFRVAKGRVLIHGLGIGMALAAILKKQEISRIDVVEIDADIIKFVGGQFSDPKLTIHCGDCLSKKWPPNTRWNYVWHDIWDGICSDNKPQMSKLSRMFGRRCDWQGFWGKEWME